MRPPPQPANEDDRLKALHDLKILDTDREEAFDRLTETAMLHFGTPVGLISLVDREREWFKSAIGWDKREVDRMVSFCAHCIGSDQPLVINDALSDDRFRDNPLVTGEPGIRFYAGAYLRTKEGLDLGALCVIDTRPRLQLDNENLDVLLNLANTVTLLLEQRRIALQVSEEVMRRWAAERRAKEDQARAEAATAGMQAFFSRMSHDLRTPLGQILGYTQLLQGDELTDDQKRDIELIQDAGRTMLKLVDGLLDARHVEGDPPGVAPSFLEE